MDLGVGRHSLLRNGEVAWIKDDGEIGTAALLVRSVDCIVESLLVVRAEGGGEMCSGREAENADPMRINVPLRGVLADKAERALGILQSSGRFRIGACAGYSVLDQDASHPDRVEPVANFGAFEIDGEYLIASARKDNDSRARVVACGAIDGKRRLRDIARITLRPSIKLSLSVVVSASGGRLVDAPGAVPGQRGIVIWPGEGGHPDGCWALRLMGTIASTAQTSRSAHLFTRSPSHCKVSSDDRSSGRCAATCGLLTALRRAGREA
jgi:hypothetical protein